MTTLQEVKDLILSSRKTKIIEKQAILKALDSKTKAAEAEFDTRQRVKTDLVADLQALKDGEDGCEDKKAFSEAVQFLENELVRVNDQVIAAADQLSALATASAQVMNEIKSLTLEPTTRQSEVEISNITDKMLADSRESVREAYRETNKAFEDVDQLGDDCTAISYRLKIISSQLRVLEQRDSPLSVTETTVIRRCFGAISALASCKKYGYLPALRQDTDKDKDKPSSEKKIDWAAEVIENRGKFRALMARRAKEFTVEDVLPPKTDDSA